MAYLFFGAAKVIAYAMLWLTALIVLARGVISPLWGSGTELGLLGAAAIAPLGVLGLFWLAYTFYRDIVKTFNQSEENQ